MNMINKIEGINISFYQCINASIDTMIDLNLSSNEREISKDYFEKLLFSFDAFSVFIVVWCIFGLFISVPGLTAVVWYERYGSNQNR